MTAFDPRLNAFRPDLADIRLKGTVDAVRFAAPVKRQAVVAVADLRREPRPDSALDTQLLYGETVDEFDCEEGWCWVQAHSDGYVGYVADTALTARISAPTHIVTAPRTFLYPGPDMKLPAEAALSMGSLLEISGSAETRGSRFAVLAGGGAVIERHAAPLGALQTDPVAVAEGFLHTPYLWGGRSGHGIDCSGLTQLAHAMCGISLQRDTEMQSKTAGREIFPGKAGEALQRGDLVFWKGHVAMMRDREAIIHANGHAMAVVIENLADATERIAPLYGLPTGYRRLAEQAFQKRLAI
jgi:cell wall-associated NlpC family hydrolase